MVIVSHSMASDEVPVGLEFLLDGPDPKYRFEENAIPTRDPDSWAKLDVISPETKQFTVGLSSELQTENSAQWEKLHAEAVEDRHEDASLATTEEKSLFSSEMLFKAANDGDQELCLRCLKAGVDPNASALLASCSVLQRATFRGFLPIVAMLLQHGADPLAPDPHGTTALHIACDRGPVEVVSLLLQARASVNKADSWGSPWPLHKAAVADHKDVAIVQLLLDAKANPHKRDLRSYTACDAAAELGESHGGVVALLQAHMQDTDGDSDDYSEPEPGPLPEYEHMYSSWQTASNAVMSQTAPNQAITQPPAPQSRSPGQAEMGGSQRMTGEWFQGEALSPEQPPPGSRDQSWFQGQPRTESTQEEEGRWFQGRQHV